METAQHLTTAQSTATLRFAMSPNLAGQVPAEAALAACPGSVQHIAAARACRRRNRERGLADVMPSACDESDIDRWEAQGIEWRVIDDHIEVFTGTRDEVHVTAVLNPEQEAWLSDHLLLDQDDADAGTGGTCWTLDGGAWCDERGFTPFDLVLIDLH